MRFKSVMHYLFHIRQMSKSPGEKVDVPELVVNRLTIEILPVSALQGSHPPSSIVSALTNRRGLNVADRSLQRRNRVPFQKQLTHDSQNACLPPSYILRSLDLCVPHATKPRL